MPQIEQVDFFDCSTEDPESNDVMAYVYYNGEECEPLVFTRPPFFEPAEVEAAMMRGLSSAVLH